LWDDKLSVKEPHEEVINSHHFAFNYNGPALFGFTVGALIAPAKENALLSRRRPALHNSRRRCQDLRGGARARKRLDVGTPKTYLEAVKASYEHFGWMEDEWRAPA
jgi:hypothetical protein